MPTRKGSKSWADKKPTTNITETHRHNFNLITDPSWQAGHSVRPCLFSCFLNGKPTAAICLVSTVPGNEITITQVFVAVTDDMVLTDHDGVQPTKD